MGLSSKMDNSALQDVFILSPMSGLYGPRYLRYNDFEILKNKILHRNFTRVVKKKKEAAAQ